MNRRKFINSLLFAAAAAATGFTMKALATTMYAVPGKLGYKLKGAKGRQCKDCKHYRIRHDEEGKEIDGECVLQVMRNAHKAQEILVKPEATCSMWSMGKKSSVQQ